MKRNEIKAEVESTLKSLGFKANQFKWSGCEVSIVLGGEFVTMRFPSGMSRRALTFEMGRVTGWVEMLRRQPPPVYEGSVDSADLRLMDVPGLVKINGKAEARP